MQTTREQIMKNQFKLKYEAGRGGTIKPLVATLALLVAAVAPAMAGDHDGGQPAYTFTTFDVPGEAPTSDVNGGTSFYGLTKRGELVGNYGVAGEYLADGVTHVVAGFLFEKDHFIDVAIPGSPWTELVGINDHGVAVGDYVDDLGNWWDFVRNPDGTIELLPPVVPGAQGNEEGIGINNEGTIVGTYRLSAPPAGSYGIAGSSGFIFKDGVYSTFNYPNAIGTHPTGINDHGDIVGIFRDANNVRHGFLLKDGSFSSIDVPVAIGGTIGGTYGEGINNAGEVVGRYLDSNSVQHGFVLSKGVYTTLDFPGASDSVAFGLNDRGQIVGTYNGGTGGFIATPVDGDGDRHD
jgi:probable HAF family extracellular repeat protein